MKLMVGNIVNWYGMGLNCLPCVSIKVRFLSNVRGCESCNHPWTHIYHGVKSHLALPSFVFLGHRANQKKECKNNNLNVTMLINVLGL